MVFNDDCVHAAAIVDDALQHPDRRRSHLSGDYGFQLLQRHRLSGGDRLYRNKQAGLPACLPACLPAWLHFPTTPRQLGQQQRVELARRYIECAHLFTCLLNLPPRVLMGITASHALRGNGGSPGAHPRPSLGMNDSYDSYDFYES